METKIFLLTILVAISVTTVLSQFVFEENDTNDKRKPQGHMRQPVTSSKCQEGELLYPGDNNADWACDCRPAFLFHPVTGKCYQAYSQGPCKYREILILPPSKVIPVCEKNLCDTGKVRYNNVCAAIGSNEGCKQPSKNPKAYQLYVNPTNLQLNCSFLNTRDGNDQIDEEAGIYDGRDCFLGGKRSQEGICV